MWQENEVLLNENRQIVRLGSHALRYVDLSKDQAMAYPAGKWKQGDILVYLCRHIDTQKECLRLLLEKMQASDSLQGATGMLLIGRVNGQGIKPIVKEWTGMEPERSFIRTIFERNEIEILRRDGQIQFNINGKTISWDAETLDHAGILISGSEITFFHGAEAPEDPVLQNMVATERFPAFMIEERIYGRQTAEVFPAAIARAMEQLEESRADECLIEYKGRAVYVKRYQQPMDTLAAAVNWTAYALEDADYLLQEIAVKSENYKQLTTGEGQDLLRGEQVFNTFRLWGTEEKTTKMEQLLQKCSVTKTTVLLTGESGTGKTFLAREIHRNSRRWEKPFVQVNCAAIPYQLIESELFGYEEGAFTGARKGGKKGYFELAAGGTLFLDEITEIPITLQGKLLEVLQNKTYYRVGGTKKLESDVRLIAATNRDLKELIREKRFREDLYYRINVFPIEIPPLRERIQSIYAIVSDLLPDICSRLEIEPLLLSSQTLEKLEHYRWPGNIRELENVLEKAAILCDGKIVLPDDIVFSEEEEQDVWMPATLKEVREKSEKEAIERALHLFRGDKIRAAQYLDIGRTNMFEKVKKYQIDCREEDDDDFR